MVSERTVERIYRIESLCAREVGRGVAALVPFARGGLLGAARSIAEHPAPAVAIVTGCFIPGAGAPETDGPVGAAHLAAGLKRAGIPVRLVTDPFCSDILQIAATAAGIPLSVDVVVPGSTAPPVSHAIFIERIGPAHDGVPRNMRGEDISRWTAPIHELFADLVVKIAAGDGGNEIGMGNVPREVIGRAIPKGDEIACSVGCDHLLLCGVSNWGAAALLAALDLLQPHRSFLTDLAHEVGLEKKVLDAIVTQGHAVDGISGKRSLSVDGLPWEYHAQIVKEILDCATDDRREGEIL